MKTSFISLILSLFIAMFAQAQSCGEVFSRGNKIKVSSKASEKWVDQVQGQLDAYNAKDLDQFVKFYAPNVRVYRNSIADENQVVSGIEAFKAAYEGIFATSPNLRAEVSQRQVESNRVTDSEHVIGLRGNENTQKFSVDYYLNEDGLIEVVVLKSVD